MYAGMRMSELGWAVCLLLRTCRTAHAVLTRMLVVYECKHNDDELGLGRALILKNY